MFELKIRDAIVTVLVGALFVWQGAILAGCDQVRPAQKPSESLGTAVQASPWVDPACYVEGPLVALECNEQQAWPWCPSEDAAQHDGQPCFWQDPNGLGLLWSDGHR